jgi:replication factor C large subunit
MGFIGLLLADKRKAIPLAAELDLDADEIALLLGSTPSTKKVQNIFEGAMKLREAEEYQDIELSWAGRAQQPLAPALTGVASAQTQAARASANAVRMGAGVTGAVQASAEKTSALRVELPKEDAAAMAAPESKPRQEEAAAPEGTKASEPAQPRKRGRPKKAEGEGKAERKAPAAGEKKQKSLFDF